MHRPSVPIIAVVAWALVVGGGVLALEKHAATPGAGLAPATDSDLPRSLASPSDKMALVMFVHPGCPCSDASIGELSTLMTTCGTRVRAFVVVAQFGDDQVACSQTSLCASARGIPGVEVRFDIDAILARKCGAQTSGQVFLYDKTGVLLFEGGITGSRGHAGDNDGLDAVTGLILSTIPHPARPIHAPVFGCAIYASTDNPTGSPLTRAPK